MRLTNVIKQLFQFAECFDQVEIRQQQKIEVVELKNDSNYILFFEKFFLDIIYILKNVRNIVSVTSLFNSF